MENNGWKELKGSATRTGEPLISITAGKLIGFNTGFMRLNKLENKTKVKMYSKEDGNNVRVGFVFYNDGISGNKLTRNGNSVGAFTSASALFNAYNLKPKDMKVTKFTPKKEMLGTEELYYIEIPQNQIS